MALAGACALGSFCDRMPFTDEMGDRAHLPGSSGILRPPTAVIGLALGGGALPEASSAALLLLVNLISVNLAATATFYVQGIRPRAWWQADRARRSAFIAMAIGGVLLASLVGITYFARR